MLKRGTSVGQRYVDQLSGMKTERPWIPSCGEPRELRDLVARRYPTSCDRTGRVLNARCARGRCGETLAHSRDGEAINLIRGTRRSGYCLRFPITRQRTIRLGYPFNNRPAAKVGLRSGAVPVRSSRAQRASLILRK